VRICDTSKTGHDHAGHVAGFDHVRSIIVSWVEVDSATTSPAETDILFGPIGTKTSFQGRVRAQLDNLPSQHDHYTLIPTYCNQAIEEIQTLGLSMGREMLDQLPRLRNWRWWDVTIAGQNWLPLPAPPPTIPQPSS
jgi:hypothetical protein